MFFVLSKVLAFLTVPSNVILSIGIVGLLLLLTRFRRAGVRLTAASLLLLLIVGVTPIGYSLIVALENRFPPGKEDGPPITGVIVLGGPIDSRMSTLRGRGRAAAGRGGAGEAPSVCEARLHRRQSEPVRH
jgi:hypothetical protein